MLIFDIETGRLPMDRLREICPLFDVESIGSHPGDFDPSTVKLGNIKDAAKKAEKIEASRIAHAEAVAKFEAKAATAEVDYWADLEKTAALSALRGEILAIGYDGKSRLLDYQSDKRTEADMLADFWVKYASCRNEGRKLIGFNIREFDVPFIVQRSWINGLDVPSTIMSGRYLDSVFVDLRDTWKVGAFKLEGSLDSIARSMGIGAKTEGVSGADFAKLFRNPETRAKAIDYLDNDLSMTRAIAERFGVL